MESKTSSLVSTEHALSLHIYIYGVKLCNIYVHVYIYIIYLLLFMYIRPHSVLHVTFLVAMDIYNNYDVPCAKERPIFEYL